MNKYKHQADYFDGVGRQYDQHAIRHMPVHTRLEQEYLAHRLPPPPLKVADFGAGSGRISIYLAKLGYEVTAIDVSPGSLAELSKLGQSMGVEIDTALQFDSHTQYDAIVGADILHHVDIVEYAPIFYAHLREGGRLVFSEPGGWHPFWYVFLTLTQDWEVEKGIIHLNIPYIRRTFEAAGFTQVQMVSLGILPTPLHNYLPTWCARVHRWIANLPILRYFGYRYVIVAKKMKNEK